MIKKTVTYTDLDGNPRSEELHFHLNKIELTELDLEYDGKLKEYIHQITSAENPDTKAIYSLFKNLILRSYGIKSEDGRSFKKNEKIREDFEQSEAFATFFYDLMANGNEQEMEAFTRGILPADVNV